MSRPSEMVGSRVLLVLAALFGAMSVGAGAIGAHSLRKQLEGQGVEESVIVKKISQCETATRYQLGHAVAILVIAFTPIANRSKALRVIGYVMLVGTGLFSGGIYSIVFADQLIHWSIVPIGGVLMIGAWIGLATWAANYGAGRKDYTTSRSGRDRPRSDE